jgi:hypothetical protein
MRMLVSLIAGVLLSVGLAEAPAARTLDDCESIKDWHAYNLCLSSFGPRRGQRSASRPPRNQAAITSRGGSRREVSPAIAVQRVKGGRVRAAARR